jgi:toxin FitB
VSFLLDTNVVSEWTKPRPNSRVTTWLHEVDEDRVFLSVITLAELRHGVEKLPAGPRRALLDAWLRDDLPLRFETRVLGVDADVADAWGRLIAASEARGRPLTVMDGFVAATATVHDLTLVTRNERDFAFALKHVLNPWR